VSTDGVRNTVVTENNNDELIALLRAESARLKRRASSDLLRAPAAL